MNVKYGQPSYLPLKNLDPSKYYRQLAEASYALGMLQTAHSKISNAEHLIKPLLTREASLSSKIEGTITDSKDVFILDATGKAPQQDTIVVANYRDAMRLAMKIKDQKGGISKYQIRQLHYVLLHRTPHNGALGKFRSKDVWIGKNKSTSIQKATYVPPFYTAVEGYMDNLVDYFNSTDETPLIKTAIFHYQFEAIHPFEDGNGRIGRMLIPALLQYQGALSAPVLYTSEYFEKKAKEYRQMLHYVDTTGDITPWIIFFLESLKEQCGISISLVEKITKLNEILLDRYEGSQSPNMNRMVNMIFETPVFQISHVIKTLKISRITASSLVNRLLEDRVIDSIRSVRGTKGATVYYFPKLLTLIS
ncbi:Fic family protein [Candidatus Saccharibacteria bacterium]|nr:Fic family protein [Candidatus Saccharibacteria bacterium]